MAGKAVRGRPFYQPSDNDRKMVEAMHACGIPEVTIAQVLQITAPTLRRHFRLELDTGTAKANMRVAQFLFNGITGPEGTRFTEERHRLDAAKFWLRCRAGWKETQVLEHIKSVYDMTDEEIEARLSIDDPERNPNVVRLRR